MMTWWSDYLEGLEKGASVIPMFKESGSWFFKFDF
ncbi:hypothetical protein SAMN05216326_14222 [Nitrosomonas marina]|uniref:Uncharacterized protein n=1 Tax=Nitrosomonas marina TaxID=917 RepID=A0A1I0FPZ7_9PROT|nr:hypothetical protein SAMN05216326_14222 [Nitrosomonas marina]